MRVEQTVTGSSATLSVTLTYNGEASASNSNEYVVRLIAQQPLRVRQTDEHTVELVVTGDWEVSDLLQAMSALRALKKSS